MLKYVAFLRGINVNGQKLIKMSDLTRLLTDEKCGFDNVSTYIQSGNVVFTTTDEKLEIKQKIESAIQNTFGFEVPTFILTNSELKHLKECHPFLMKYPLETNSIYFTFLDEIPNQELVNELNKLTQETEFFVINDKLIFCYYPNGYGNSKWNTIFFEKKLKVNCTTRNYNTVNKLIELSEKLV